MEKLISKLKKLALDLETNKDNLFYLGNGTDLSELIEKCKTDEDILELARKIRDYLIEIDDQYEYQEFNGLMPNFPETNAVNYVDNYGDDDERGGFDEDEEEDHTIARGIIEKYHAGTPNDFIWGEEDEEDDDESENLTEKIGKLLEELVIEQNWKTWGECLKSLGYQETNLLNNFPMDSFDDIIEIVGDIEITPGVYLEESEKFGYIEEFLRGSLDGMEIVGLANSIILFCEGNNDEYVETPEEYEEEIKEDLKEFRQMLEDQCEFPGDEENQERILKRLRELDSENLNYDEMMEIWDEIEEFHDEEDDKIYDEDYLDKVIGSQKEERKRARTEFDMKDDPIAEIRFEQGQTDLLLDELAMDRLTMEIAQDFCGDFKFTPEAMEAIQTAAESYLIEIFQDANLTAVNAELTHIAPKHIQVAKRIKKDE
jgi:histone H3/H4